MMVVFCDLELPNTLIIGSNSKLFSKLETFLAHFQIFGQLFFIFFEIVQPF